MTSQDHYEELDYVTFGYTPIPVSLVEGKGCVVKDDKGKSYIDLMSGSAGPQGVGYSHPKVVSAVKNQLDKIPSMGYYGT